LRRRNLALAINSAADPVQNPVVAAQPEPHTDRTEGTRSVHPEENSEGTPSEPDSMADERERDAGLNGGLNGGLNNGGDDAQDSDDDNADFVPRTLREFNVPRAGDVKGAIRLPRIA